MEKLDIIKKNAIVAYKNANKDSKKLLEDLFGEKTFTRKHGFDIKTLQDACEATGANIEGLSFSDKLFTIVCAINGDWLPDWSNSNERKYYPWFNMSASGFSFCGYDDSQTASHVGSRLVFKSQELAEYAGKQFLSYYKEFMTL